MRRGRRRVGLALAALVVGIGGVAASAAGISAQLLPRTFTAAQQKQIMAWETARRWRTLPAGKIFPATVRYHLPGYALGSVDELAQTAHRAGIAPQASCAAASDPVAAQILAGGRCARLLRATYIDGTGSLVVTVGVAVMRGPRAAAAAARSLSAGRQPRPGVHAVRFRGTLASRFRNRQRQLSWAQSAGPYLILSAAGYADGRPRVRVPSDTYADVEMTSLARGVADTVGAPLGALPPPPRCPGAPGC